MIILHIAESITGGVATILNSVCHHQANQHETKHIYVLIPKNQKHSFTVPPSEKLTVILFDGGKRFSRIISLALSIIKNIWKIKPDIVHLHSTFAGLVFRSTVPSFFYKKSVYQPHGVAFDIDRVPSKSHRYLITKIEKLLSLRSHAIIAISEHEKKELDRANIHNTYLIKNGVKESTTTLFGQPPTNDCYLFIGRFDPQKGLDLLIDTWTTQNIRSTLKLAGTKVIEDSLASTQSTLQSKSVEYLGWIPPNQIDNLIYNAKALIVPSRWEGFGLVVAEAYRNGTPVITSNRGALPELVTEKSTGMVFDLDKISSSLPDCIASFELLDRNELSHNCKERFDATMHESIMTDKVLKLYYQLLTG